VHVNLAPEPHDLWSAWTWSPTVLAGLAAAAYAYTRGLRALWTRAGRGRVVSGWRAASYFAGLASVFIALVSPVDAIGGALFSVHMTQHLLLIMVAAPLIVLGDPVTVTLWAFPVRWRRRIGLAFRQTGWLRAAWGALTIAPIAWSIHVVTLWLWHAPIFYEMALRSETVHEFEHATFFVTALLFWWLLFAPHGRRLSIGVKVAYLFAAMLQGTILGAVITFARHPWYVSYFGTTKAWGLTPLEDQQLAGLIMWIPAGLIYLAALLPLLAGALAEREGGKGRMGEGEGRFSLSPLLPVSPSEPQRPADAVAVPSTSGTP
jgi:putative membrane protein